jgi:alanine racemase
MNTSFHGHKGYRPTWAEINLDSLAFNYSQIKLKLREGTKIMVCVKADAYGHGLVPVARKLVSLGVDYLAVASIDEAIRLRLSGISAPVLVLGPVLCKDIAPLFMYSITPTVCRDDLACALNDTARLFGTRMKIHVKIDTGMGRVGVRVSRARLPNLEIEGIFTHLACADTNRALTVRQISEFSDLVGSIRDAGIDIPLVHAANSMGVVAYPESHFAMVRPGLILYGIPPADGLSISLRPVLSLKTRVIFEKRVPEGTGISYGHTYTTKKPARIVTLPIGYGDGYPRNLSNTGPVLLRGRKFSISGRVCMDQMMVDVGTCPVRVEDEAVLIGAAGGETISARDLSEMAGTIPYEIVCGLGSRVPRVYVGDTEAEDKASALEKRREARVPWKVPVRLTDRGTGSFVRAFSEDMSPIGIGLMSAERLVPGREVGVQMQIPGEGPAINAKGRIVWARQESGCEFRAGIAFDGTGSAGDLRKIFDQVNAQSQDHQVA